jgi:Domain of unknown function (DUF4406)
MTKTAYLSGPMRGFPLWNFPAFDRNAEFLRDNGWKIISPAEVDRELGFDENDPTAVFTEADFEVAIRRDYVALTEVDAIIFMNGWENSTGAKLESDFANVLKLDRYRVDADKSYFEKELVLGLTGYARVGKDTIAQQFVENQGFERHGFADALKNILYALNPIVSFYGDVLSEAELRGGSCRQRIQELVDPHLNLWSNEEVGGWEYAKTHPEVRQLLQRLGTEGGRVALGADVWVKALFSQPTAARVVVPDVRFENEAAAIRARGGKVIRINREGIGPVNDHVSDQISFETDFEVDNDGTPKETYLQIVDYLASVGLEL